MTMTLSKELAYREMLRMLSKPFCVSEQIESEFYKIIKKIISEYGYDMVEEIENDSLREEIAYQLEDEAYDYLDGTND